MDVRADVEDRHFERRALVGIAQERRDFGAPIAAAVAFRCVVTNASTRDPRGPGTSSRRDAVKQTNVLTSRSRSASTLAVLIGAGLFIATSAVYAPVIDHAFINYDDPEYVSANPHVLRALTPEGVMWALTTTRPHNWHPVTWLSHMLDVELFGANAGRHLLINVGLHAANAVLLFSLLFRMTGALAPSAVVAALFALHPLHVESVAWVSERKDVLSTLFWMLAATTYVTWVKQPRPRTYVLSVVLFALAVMSKPMVVTFPFVLLLLDYWPLRRVARLRALLIEKIPFFAVALVGVAVTIVAQRTQAMTALANLPLRTRLANAALSYVAYMRKTLWPVDLAVFYPYPMQTSMYRGLAAATLLLGASILVVRLRRTRPYLVVGWFWFLGTLVPVSGIAQAGVQAMADRFAYLPIVGLFIIAAWGMADLVDSLRHERAMLALTNDAETHRNMGLALYQRGDMDGAVVHFTQATRLQPDDAQAQNNLGAALEKQGQIEQAIVHYAEAIRLDPSYERARSNLAALRAHGAPGKTP